MKVLKEWIIVKNITHNSFPIHSVKGCYKTRNKKNVLYDNDSDILNLRHKGFTFTYVRKDTTFVMKAFKTH